MRANPLSGRAALVGLASSDAVSDGGMDSLLGVSIVLLQLEVALSLVQSSTKDGALSEAGLEDIWPIILVKRP